MRGVILAGGSGTRLHPVTLVVSKQLLPVYDRPMIHYSLSVLMEAGVRDILVISTPDHLASYERLLGDGRSLGLRLCYAPQPEPRGLAEALLIGREFIGDNQIALILGDNVFHSPGLRTLLRRERERLKGCTLFGCPVPDPHRYGVAELDSSGRITSLVEKPERPTSNLAVVGLYLYDNEAVSRAAELKPSDRGELEITDLNRTFVESGTARLVTLDRETTWFDTGTHDSLLQASVFIREQARRGRPVGRLEDVARYMGFVRPGGHGRSVG
ncbi:sugar nucleotidyltransferase [Streptomyces bacillaris]|uniref:sugar nucleotidyltransferase n=1 Tax=Streptomyces bacillaris TaxID=68179 RepID=UPI003460654F